MSVDIKTPDWINVQFELICLVHVCDSLQMVGEKNPIGLTYRTWSNTAYVLGVLARISPSSRPLKTKDLLVRPLADLNISTSKLQAVLHLQIIILKDNASFVSKQKEV